MQCSVKMTRTWRARGRDEREGGGARRGKARKPGDKIRCGEQNLGD